MRFEKTAIDFPCRTEELVKVDCSTTPALYVPILQRLLMEGPSPLGKEPVTAVLPLRELQRPFSSLLQLELHFPGRRWSGYIKIGLPSSLIVDSDNLPYEVIVQREYELLLRLDKLFRADPLTRTVRPVACYPEYRAMVTEEVPGIELFPLLQSKTGLFSCQSSVEQMEQACKLCGQWLSKFQAATVAGTGEKFSLDEMREYVDRRLVELVERHATGFDAVLRKRVLDYFDSLANKVPVAALSMTGVHGDFSAVNVMIANERITVMDFATFAHGSTLHDVVFFWHRLNLLALDPRCNKKKITRVAQAFLDGYDAYLDTESPLFQLFYLQHVVCFVLTQEERSGRGSVQDRLRRFWIARNQIRWLIKVCNANTTDHFPHEFVQ